MFDKEDGTASGMIFAAKDLPMQRRILILEVHHERLTCEGQTALGDRIVAIIGASATDAECRVRRVRINSTADVHAKLHKRGKRPPRYDAVVVVGHASPFGVEVSPTEVLSWDELGRALASRRPRVAVLVACSAGFQMATDPLMEAIPSLDVVYASPALVTIDDAAVALFRAWSDVWGPHEAANDWGALAQLGALVLTGSGFVRRTRSEAAQQTRGQRLLEDVLLALVSQVRRQELNSGRRPTFANG